MTKQNDGGPAFPAGFVAGMTMRDYFAGQALAGMCASLTNSVDWPTDDGMVRLASIAYAQADAMLKEREK